MSLYVSKFRSAPDGQTEFECLVRHLHLQPSEYCRSVTLKEWVRTHKDERYVPPLLLSAWGFDVDVDGF